MVENCYKSEKKLRHLKFTPIIHYSIWANSFLIGNLMYS